MGMYINPPNMTKEQFLERFGIECQLSDLAICEDMLPVVLVDNGFFTAAAIAYSDKELKRFTNPSETRPRMYYMVPREALKPYMEEDL